MGDAEAWDEAWRCICKGIKKKKAAECSSVWMSEYYCKYCEPTGEGGGMGEGGSL